MIKKYKRLMIQNVNKLGIDIGNYFHYDNESREIYNRAVRLACDIETVEDMEQVTEILTILNNRVLNFSATTGIVNGQIN